MTYDSEKAKLVRLLEGLEKLVSEGKARDAQELETGKCSRCGAQLLVAWPPGRKESSSVEPLIFCEHCFDEPDQG